MKAVGLEIAALACSAISEDFIGSYLLACDARIVVVLEWCAVSHWRIAHKVSHVGVEQADCAVGRYDVSLIVGKAHHNLKRLSWYVFCVRYPGELSVGLIDGCYLKGLGLTQRGRGVGLGEDEIRKGHGQYNDENYC